MTRSLVVVPILLCLFSTIVGHVTAFCPQLSSTRHLPFIVASTTATSKTSLYLLEQKQTEQSKQQDENNLSVDEITQKYGLEVGLTQALLKKKSDGDATSGTESAKSLLKKYGIAYLATSIPLAILSFSVCYVLVDQGVNVSQLLAQIGISEQANETADQAGTLALAYAAHKAASPIRFPPTVLLTPIVAKWIGKEPNEEADDDE
jgi:hypothetical protein